MCHIGNVTLHGCSWPSLHGPRKNPPQFHLVKEAYRDIVRYLRPWGVPIFVKYLHLHPKVFAFLITKCSGRMWYINSFAIISTCNIVSSLIEWSPCLHWIFFFLLKLISNRGKEKKIPENIGYCKLWFGTLLSSHYYSSRNEYRLDSYFFETETWFILRTTFEQITCQVLQTINVWWSKTFTWWALSCFGDTLK